MSQMKRIDEREMKISTSKVDLFLETKKISVGGTFPKINQLLRSKFSYSFRSLSSSGTYVKPQHFHFPPRKSQKEEFLSARPESIFGEP